MSYDRGAEGQKLSPVHHGITIASQVSRMILAGGDVIMVLLQLVVIVADWSRKTG